MHIISMQSNGAAITLSVSVPVSAGYTDEYPATSGSGRILIKIESDTSIVKIELLKLDLKILG